MLFIFLLKPTVDCSVTESPTNLAESHQILRLPLDPLRNFDGRQLTFPCCRTPRFAGHAPCRTVTGGVIGLEIGPDYLHVCIAFCIHLPRKLLLPLRPFPPKRHNIMSGQHTDTRTHHNRCHVLTRNSITFNLSTSALSKVRSLCWFLWNEYRMLHYCDDQSPHNATFPCLIVTIHNVDREIPPSTPFPHVD